MHLLYSREFTHRVKSVSMAKFTSQEVDALQKGGNQVILFSKASMFLIIYLIYQLVLTETSFQFAEG